MNFITGESTNIEKVGISSLVPNTDNTLDVGTSSKRWRDGRFVNLAVGGGVNVGTELTSLDGRVGVLEDEGGGGGLTGARLAVLETKTQNQISTNHLSFKLKTIIL